MDRWGYVFVVVLALALTILIQIRVSKMHSSVLGLVIPMLIFLVSCMILLQDISSIRKGMQESLTCLTACVYFSLYNIPTILFLCIYNYYQRMRISRLR